MHNRGRDAGHDHDVTAIPPQRLLSSQRQLQETDERSVLCFAVVVTECLFGVSFCRYNTRHRCTCRQRCGLIHCYIRFSFGGPAIHRLISVTRSRFFVLFFKAASFLLWILGSAVSVSLVSVRLHVSSVAQTTCQNNFLQRFKMNKLGIYRLLFFYMFCYTLCCTLCR